ncbi:hypothetical protein [Kitasatospora sp. NPDC096204]|uniref:hypothetical protein n=1 Tax=Kitasatospora sp. NPDC096204 TaxID=3364094 RepID=UPI00382B36EB
MNRRIRAASLCAVLAAAVLVGGTAQAYATAASPAQAPAAAPAAVTPVAQEGASALAIDIWHWVGRYDSYFAAEAAYWVLYGMGSAVMMKIEQTYADNAPRWELYIQ